MTTDARARDLYSSLNGAGHRIESEDWFKVQLSPQRMILGLATSRQEDDLQALVGLSPGGPVRARLPRVVAVDVAAGTPLNLLLDDLAGASFVTPGAWFAWSDDWRAHFRAAFGDAISFENDVTGVCIGFRPGSTALTEACSPDFERQGNVDAPPPERDDDPLAWHVFPQHSGPNHRRSRRLDLWIDAGMLHADVWFQDSNALPDTSSRRIVHEYRVTASIDPAGLHLRSLDVMPAVLPYGECRAGAVNAAWMIGQPIVDFRRAVPATLPGAHGCTHLNDVLRGLQDIGAMADTLRSCLAREGADAALADPG